MIPLPWWLELLVGVGLLIGVPMLTQLVAS